MTRSPATSRVRRSNSVRLLAGAGLIALLGGTAAIALSSQSDADQRAQTVAVATATVTTTPTPTPIPPRPKRIRVPVRGIGAYDPDGDQSENDGDAGLATDGNLSTAWTSERYRSSFAKTGVGLVVDAARPVKATRVVVVTKTPGYTAEVRIGSSPRGPFVAVAKGQVARTRTTFALRPRRGRYLMLWITSMPDGGAAAVNEITASAAG